MCIGRRGGINFCSMRIEPVPENWDANTVRPENKRWGNDNVSASSSVLFEKVGLQHPGRTRKRTQPWRTFRASQIAGSCGFNRNACWKLPSVKVFHKSRIMITRKHFGALNARAGVVFPSKFIVSRKSPRRIHPSKLPIVFIFSGQFVLAKKSLALLLVLVSLTIFAQKPLSENAQISVLTLGPFQGVLFSFGHSAIRVYDPASGSDLVFNYGVLIRPAKLLPEFYRGHLLYKLGVYPFDLFHDHYISHNRYVHEQVLQPYAGTKQKCSITCSEMRNLKM